MILNKYFKIKLRKEVNYKLPKKRTNEEFIKEVKKLVGDEYTPLEEYKNNTTKIDIKHNKCGNIFKMDAKHFLRGHRCPYCAGKMKKTTEQFKKEVYNLVGDEYTVLGEYKNNAIKILMKHNKCGYEFEMKPNNFLSNGNRCPKCYGYTKKDTEYFKNEVKKLYNNDYSVLEEYKNGGTLIKIRHNKCGHEYSVVPDTFIDGYSKCPICYPVSNKRLTTIEFKKRVKDLVGDEYTVLGKYVTSTTPVLIRHNLCGHEYKVRPSDFQSKNNRCPKCYGNAIKTNDEFKKEVYDLVGDEYTVLDPYIGNKKKIRFKHNKCGHIWSMIPYSFIKENGNRCPYCSNLMSNEEKEVLEYIKSLDSNLIIEENNRKILNNRKELDIYLPDKNIAIEFDGLYWHSDERIENNYHLEKTNLCEEKGIHLIHIFEDEWINKKDIVKDKLSSILGYNSETIYARECYIKEIKENGIKNKFLEENHIQGKDNSCIKLGLYTDNKYYEEEVLVAIMTFCKPRKALGHNSNTEYDYELSRYSGLLGYNIVGGFSKLFKYFEKNYKWNKTITYADRRWSNSKNNVYFKNNFTLEKISKPNYWYIKTKSNNYKRYHRYNFRKNKLKDMFPDSYNNSKSEKEIMKENGYLRIYDCGNLVFSYTRKE